MTGRTPTSREARPHERADQSITWTCDTCDRPIADGQGYVHIAPHEAIERASEIVAWETRRTDESGLRIVTVADISSMPADIAWRIQHSACDPQPDGPNYWIDVERIRGMDDLAWWTLHLHEKRWVRKATDWDEVAHAAIDRWRAGRLRIVS